MSAAFTTLPHFSVFLGRELSEAWLVGGRRRRSEVRVCGLRNVIVEQMLVVLGAHLFCHWLLYAIVTLDPRPGLNESVRIFDPHVRFQRLAAIEQRPPFHHVQLLGVWRA